MAKPLLSIVIPVYNVESYIRQCLDSVVNQTLKNIEIIIVNDCSPANEDAIIQEYMKKDPRIVYIKNEKNIGQGASRNIAFAQAKGHYFGCIDSDDYIALDMFEKMYNKAIEKNLDVCWCQYSTVDCLKNNKETQVLLPKKFENKYAGKALSFEDCSDYVWGLAVAPWTRIYKRDYFYKYISYSELKHEDVVPYFVGWLNSNKISYINEPLYFYRINRDGQTTSKTHKNEILIFLNEVINLFKEKKLYDKYKLDLCLYITRVYSWYKGSKDLYESFRTLILAQSLSKKEVKKLKNKNLKCFYKYSYEEKEQKKKLYNKLYKITKISKLKKQINI